MQRWVFAGLSVFILLGIACMQIPNENKEEGYTIIFDSMPDLYGDQIYYANREIGKILSKTEGATGIVKMVAELDAAFTQEMGANIAFYSDHGQLKATRLESSGEPLSKEALLCGFSSKGGLNWFRLKTLFKNRISAANRRALSLYRKSGLT